MQRSRYPTWLPMIHPTVPGKQFQQTLTRTTPAALTPGQRDYDYSGTGAHPTGPASGPARYPPPINPTGPGEPGGPRPPRNPPELDGMPIRPPPPTGPAGPGAEASGRRPVLKWVNPPLGSAADFVFRPFFPPMGLLSTSRSREPPARIYVSERTQGPGYGSGPGVRGGIHVEYPY